MKKQFLGLILAIVLFLSLQLLNLDLSPIENSLLPTPTPQVLGETATTSTVRVIDGDTIQVSILGRKETVRVIGINTPETVDPRRPIECFGRQASEKAKSLLEGKSIRLESDPTQSDRDRYGRILRYIFLPDGADYGLIMIKEGYAYEYTYDEPYKFQNEYKNAQKQAESLRIGLWGEANCPN